MTKLQYASLADVSGLRGSLEIIKGNSLRTIEAKDVHALYASQLDGQPGVFIVPHEGDVPWFVPWTMVTGVRLAEAVGVKDSARPSRSRASA